MRLVLVMLLTLAALVPPICLPASEPRFSAAVPGRVLSFPKDHGRHPEFQTEWWYFTGNLESTDGGRWGFQLTFFRRAFAPEPSEKGSAWRVKDLYPAHFALTDLKNGRFHHAELLSREGPGLAAAADDRLDVFVKDWSAKQEDDGIRVQAHADGRSIDLLLVPHKPPALHGREGFSQKGDRENQASYYYSFTRLGAAGRVTCEGATHQVTGLAWMDHEFGSGILAPDQAGWDWAALHLDDGTDVMAFHMRKKDGTFEQAFGTVVKADGSVEDLHGKKIAMQPLGTWTSPRTKAKYPSGWRLTVPGLDIDLRITPALEDQELETKGSTRIIYWEGAVVAEGSRAGKKVKGKGYVELTGYAHSMAGRL
jgi:predicted secreted hydrolase